MSAGDLYIILELTEINRKLSCLMAIIKRRNGGDDGEEDGGHHAIHRTR